MQIIHKISASNQNTILNPPVTLAFLGDSVTQGFFWLYPDAENVYHNRLKKKLLYLYPNAMINVINAGINGTSALQALPRLDRDVLKHNPDLCVVCFGLNDVTGREEGMDLYINSLKEIFERLQAAGSEIIFMTPNMYNTRAVDYTPDCYKEYSRVSCELQNEGFMDMYMEAAKKLAAEYKVPVCDCYAKWKRLAECGVDTTMLLSNGINHPREDMHDMFANALLEMMFR